MSLPSPTWPPVGRRLLPRVLLCLSLALAMAAAPWWQQALARSAGATEAAAICSVGNTAPGSGPAHSAAGHCQLCCGGQWQHALPESGMAIASAAGISYPLPATARAERSVGLAPGSPRARAPPAA